MIIAAQCRMARAAIGWSTHDLAHEARVGISTVSRFETGQANPNSQSLAAIQRAFESAGVRFTEHGVEMPPSIGMEHVGKVSDVQSTQYERLRLECIKLLRREDLSNFQKYKLGQVLDLMDRKQYDAAEVMIGITRDGQNGLCHPEDEIPTQSALWNFFVNVISSQK